MGVTTFMSHFLECFQARQTFGSQSLSSYRLLSWLAWYCFFAATTRGVCGTGHSWAELGPCLASPWGSLDRGPAHLQVWMHQLTGPGLQPAPCLGQHR